MKTNKIKLDRELYKYVEYQLKHYRDYAERLDNLVDDIHELKSRRYTPLLQSLDEQYTAAEIAHIKTIVIAIRHSLNNLDEKHLKLFEMFYIQSKSKVYISMNLYISERTFDRYKRNIVYLTAIELGILPLKSYHRS